MAKVQITACHLKELGQYAKGHGTEYAFVDLACDWAAQADVHLIKLEGLLQRCLPFLESRLHIDEASGRWVIDREALDALITEIKGMHAHIVETPVDASTEVKTILETVVIPKGQDAT